MLICIDAGHGGEDRHNRGENGYVEADGVLDISLKLEKMLKYSGYDVVMTRTKDKTVSLQERSRISNEADADLFLSIHTNAADDTSVGGIETFYTSDCEDAKKYADIIQNNLIKDTELNDRGIKTRKVDNPSSNLHGKDYYSVIRETDAPALILELGFHTNPTEEKLLLETEFRHLLAESIYNSIQKIEPLDKEHWKLEGIDYLSKLGFVNDKEYWLERLEDTMPTWAIMLIMKRIHRDLL